MATDVRTTDAKGRLILPRSFANATVVVEQVSETELRVRRARVVPEDELRFPEEGAVPLNRADRDRFLALLAHPATPNRALKRAMRRLNPTRG